MQLSLRLSGGSVAPRMVLSGEIDISTIAPLRHALHDVLSEGASTVTIDLAGVRFMDSSGIGVLVAAHRRAQHTGVPLRLVHPTPIVAKVLALTGVDQLLTVEHGEPGTSALAG